ADEEKCERQVLPGYRQVVRNGERVGQHFHGYSCAGAAPRVERLTIALRADVETVKRAKRILLSGPRDAGRVSLRGRQVRPAGSFVQFGETLVRAGFDVVQVQVPGRIRRRLAEPI